jgi:predicted lactoylglutathione lyase
VQDLAASREFYEPLGFSINEHPSDEHTAAVVVDDNLVVMLRTRGSFPLALGDAASDPTVVNCLTVDGRTQVDDLVAKAPAPAGQASRPGRRDDLHRQLRRPGRPRLADPMDGPAARGQLIRPEAHPDDGHG